MNSEIRSEIATASIEDDAIAVTWADDHLSLFHFLWLRDNCSCHLCGSHTSGTRFQALLEIPESISPSEIVVDSTNLSIVWANDGHHSSFPSTWLRRHCYSSVERARRRRPVIKWTGDLQPLPTVNYGLIRKDATERRSLFSSVWKYGFVIVQDVGTRPDEIERLADLVGYIRDSHFGRIGDLQLRPDPSMIANFPLPLLPHTDETYRSVPSGVVIFQCLQASEDGGGQSTLVDSYNCVERLRREDPEAFGLLCRVPIQHERYTGSELIRSAQPVITLDADGEIASVRLNERTMSAISVPVEVMRPTYRAVRKLLSIAYDAKNRVVHRLEAGQALVFDNLRVLHGRTAFKGARHLRQCNVVRDEFFARFEYLEDNDPTAHSS